MESKRLYALAPARPRGVDRKTKSIFGCCVAQKGVFREDLPRGSFNDRSLAKIVQLVNAARDGIKCHLGHPNIIDDKVADFVGRFKNAALDGDCVRATLFIDKSAEIVPGRGNVADWLMTRCQSDPTSLCSSLIVGDVEIDPTDRSDNPAWIPHKITACDLVDEGAAVSSLLSSGGTRLGRYAARLDAMNSKVHGMPLDTQLAEERYQQQHADPKPAADAPFVTVLGYASVFGHAHDAGYERPNGGFAKHLFQRGAFQFACTQPCKLFVDHYTHPTYASTADGSLQLSEDDIGLLIKARITDQKLIADIQSGVICGMSIMGVPERNQQRADVIVHQACGLDEVSLTSKGPGNPLTAVVIAELPVPSFIYDAVIVRGDTTRLQAQRAVVIRQLLKHREWVAC